MGEKMAKHVSVLLERCIELLTPAIERSKNPVIVDATLGLGGHTEALLQRFPNLVVIVIETQLLLHRTDSKTTGTASSLFMRCTTKYKDASRNLVTRKSTEFYLIWECRRCNWMKSNGASR